VKKIHTGQETFFRCFIYFTICFVPLDITAAFVSCFIAVTFFCSPDSNLLLFPSCLVQVLDADYALLPFNIVQSTVLRCE